ncbi:MAG: FeoA family protein [Bacteroidota bacterium]|nr:ferrous iron transport protein A [Candidatus Kapabacteria bacterium]MDW8221222.1 FeoA family protein [Bacteroidota bacterium]
MDTLPVGAVARVITYTHQDPFTERLREIGLVPGTVFRLLRKAPFNGPVEIQYRTSRVVVRPHELAHMRIERIA